MKATLFWSDEAAIVIVADALRQGQVVVGSSDTVLGFLADTSQHGFNSLNAIKQRTDKPYLLLLDCQEKLTHFVQEVSPLAQTLMDACWPGPLTIIFKAKTGLPAYITSIDATIAIRVPKHDGILALASNFQGLFSTSANLSGQPVPNSLADLDESIARSVHYAIKDIHEEAFEKVPSTIVDCTGPELRIIREGAFKRHELESIVGRAE